MVHFCSSKILMEPSDKSVLQDIFCDTNFSEKIFNSITLIFQCFGQNYTLCFDFFNKRWHIRPAISLLYLHVFLQICFLERRRQRKNHYHFLLLKQI